IVSASDRGAPSMRQRRYDRENYRETIAYPDSTCSDEFRRWSTMDQNLFNDICLQQLTLSGVHEGETVVVLTRGAERAEYADAFLWAAQRLGAATFHMRLPSPDSASGAWAVGQSGLDRIPRAVEALSAADMVVDCTFLLFSKRSEERRVGKECGCGGRQSHEKEDAAGVG